jgi:hypothetical protein
MSHAGEFRLCSGCGQWAIWTPQRRTGPIFCCEACARGLRCACSDAPGEGVPFTRSRREVRPGGSHALHEPVPARSPRA